MKRNLIAATLLACTPFATMAAGYVEGYYVNAELEASVGGASGDVDGDGFGVRASHQINPGMFFTGEAETLSYDGNGDDLDIRFIRAGLGVNSNPETSLIGFGYGEIVNARSEAAGESESDTGYGVHVGGKLKASDKVHLLARLGFVDVGDSDGVEGLVSGTFHFTPNVGATLAYRMLNQGADGVDLDLTDWRFGVRYTY